MSADTLNFPTPSQSDVPNPADIQGADSLYNAIQSVYASLHELVAPYSESPEIVRAYGEAMRYIELVTMYSDRISFMIRNPDLMAKVSGEEE